MTKWHFKQKHWNSPCSINVRCLDTVTFSYLFSKLANWLNSCKKNKKQYLYLVYTRPQVPVLNEKRRTCTIAPKVTVLEGKLLIFMKVYNPFSYNTNHFRPEVEITSAFTLLLYYSSFVSESFLTFILLHPPTNICTLYITTFLHHTDYITACEAAPAHDYLCNCMICLSCVKGLM